VCVRVSLVRSQARRDGGMHPTPLRGRKIGAFCTLEVLRRCVVLSLAARVKRSPLGRKDYLLVNCCLSIYQSPVTFEPFLS